MTVNTLLSPGALYGFFLTGLDVGTGIGGNSIPNGSYLNCFSGQYCYADYGDEDNGGFTLSFGPASERHA